MCPPSIDRSPRVTSWPSERFTFSRLAPTIAASSAWGSRMPIRTPPLTASPYRAARSRSLRAIRPVTSRKAKSARSSSCRRTYVLLPYSHDPRTRPWYLLGRHWKVGGVPRQRGFRTTDSSGSLDDQHILV